MQHAVPPSPGDVIVISDLHLATSRHDPFCDDVALIGFLDNLARRAGAGTTLHLVLLGDTLDFTLVEHGGHRLDPTPAGALARSGRTGERAVDPPVPDRRLRQFKAAAMAR